MFELLCQPWSWYIAGPLIGLIVPTLLILGNKSFGVSANLRHICAACIPAKVPFFQYDWKKEIWNLIFVLGIFLGGIIAIVFQNPNSISIHPDLQYDLRQYGISDFEHLLPQELFSWDALFTLRGFVLMVIGGFLIGFGTRYGGGCTSGHAIMGLSDLQIPSLVATISFMIGGFLMTHLLLPYILAL